MMKLLHATLPQVFSVAVPYYQQVFSNYTQIAHAGANVREPFVFIYVDEKLTIVRYQRGTESAMVSVQEYNFFGCSLTTTSTISPFLIHTPTMSKMTGGKMLSSADSADDDILVHISKLAGSCPGLDSSGQPHSPTVRSGLDNAG